MSSTRLGHLDESGRVCESHPIDTEKLLQLAAIGARAPSFNHDIASKIQGVMMALDEIIELADGELKATAETAQGAMGELNQLLQTNRALTKTPATTPTSLHDLLSKAATRVGVTLRGAKASCDVNVAVPLLTQAFAMAFDSAGGAERRRTLELGVKIDERVELVFPIAASAAPQGEGLAIAAWIVEREGGTLRCSDKAITIVLPLAQ